jgi:hypothetical protein
MWVYGVTLSSAKEAFLSKDYYYLIFKVASSDRLEVDEGLSDDIVEDPLWFAAPPFPFVRHLSHLPLCGHAITDSLDRKGRVKAAFSPTQSPIPSSLRV